MRLAPKNVCVSVAAMMAVWPFNPVLAQDAPAASTPEPLNAAAVSIPRITSVPGVPDGACHDGHEGPRVLLSIARLKKPVGQFRIELYGDVPELFLEGEGQVYRYFAPMIKTPQDTICLAVPDYGNYGLLVIHDMDGDSKPDYFTDGFGLSTNPKLALRRPKLEEARFTVSQDETALEIKMQYVTGSGKKRSRGSKR